LLHGHARPAQSLLPANHWAWTDAVERYDFDPTRAEQMLDQAGLPRASNGVRFHLMMKTSTDEDTRLLAAVLQQQLAKVGIVLDQRSYEFATFYSDVTRGAFQMYSMRWIGGNEQPDIFGYAFSTARFSPKGANRGHYSNAQLDALLDDASANSDNDRRRADYVEAQQILARDLPAVNLRYKDTVVVHNCRLTQVTPTPSGSYTFLETAGWPADAASWDVSPVFPSQSNDFLKETGWNGYEYKGNDGCHKTVQPFGTLARLPKQGERTLRAAFIRGRGRRDV
jgi:peptide/nickel transport system substrate-binding protein